MKLRNTAVAITLAATSVIGFTAYAASDSEAGMEKSITPRVMADALHLVMDSDRAVYTQKIVGRLAAKEKVITASEHFEDEKALVLPAQMFRFGSELVAERAEKKPDINFSYSLQSLWPINKQNAPKTEAEKAGLQYIVDNPGKNYYANEKLGDTTYFTAVYPDVAVAQVCATCHNDHKDSPRDDFELGDTLGGVVIRIPVDG